MAHFRSVFIFLSVLFASLAAQATDGALALAVLKSDASLEAKARACQSLAVVGDARAIPLLADLLGDPALAANARAALEAMDEPEAGEALRAALPNVEGELLIGVITSLGVKRDQQAVDSLSALAEAESSEVSSAALIALAQIATEDSAQVILSALENESPRRRLHAADAALLAADRAAKNGNESLALKLSQAVQTADVPEHIHKAVTNR